MKTILLWNPRVPVLAPVRLALPDSVASALVRCGVAAAADPADQGALEAGGAMTWENLIEVAIESGPLKGIQRVSMPDAAVAIAASLGIAGVVDGAAPGGGPVDIPAPVNTAKPTISGAASVGLRINQTLTFTNGTWTGEVTNFTTRLLLGGSAVSAAYVWQLGDAGAALVYEVTANGPQHSTVAPSDPFTVSYAVRPAYDDGAALTGVLTNGATITIGYGDWTDADSLVITLKADDATVGSAWSIDYGDAAPTFTYNAATMDGRLLLAEIVATNTASGLTRTIETPARVGVGTSDEVSFTANFTGPVDTPVADENGWLIAGDAGGISYAKAAYVKSPGGDLQMKYHPGGRFLARVATANSGFEVGWPFTSTSTSIYREYFVLGTDYQNFVQVVMRYDRIFVMQRKAGSEVAPPGVSNILGPFGANATLACKIRNSGGSKYLRLFVDGAEVSSGINGGLGVGPIDAALASGTMVGVGGGNDAGDHYVLCRSFKVLTPPVQNVYVGVSGVTQSPADPTKQRITISGDYSLPDNLLEWALVDPIGAVSENWTDIVSEAAGVYSDTVDIAYADGGNPTVYVRSKTNPAVIGSATFASVVLPVVGDAIFGTNEGFLAYWSPATPFVNMGVSAEWSVGGDIIFTPANASSPAVLTSVDGSVGIKVGLDGTVFPDNTYGYTAYQYRPPCYYVDAGTYEIQLVPGLTLTPHGTAPTGYNSTTGKITFDVAADGFIDGWYDVATASMPPTGIPLPTIKRVGESVSTPTLRATAGAVREAVGHTVRVLDLHRANNCNNRIGGRTLTQLPVDTPSNVPTGAGNEGLGAPYYRAYLDAGIDLWIPERHTAGDALISYNAAILATSSTMARVISELSNEVWNRGFDSQFHETKVEGCRRGYGDASKTTHAACTPVTIIDGRYDGGINRNTRLSTLAFASGDKVYVDINGRGEFVYRAKQAVAAGATIPLPEALPTADWEMFLDGAAVQLAAKRYLGRRSKEIWALQDAEFLAAGKLRPLHVISWQAASTFDDIRPALDFDGVKLVTDAVAIGPYWGGGVAGSDLSAFDRADHGWTEAQKAKFFNGNDAAGVTDYIAAASQSIQATIAWCRDYWTLPVAAYSRAERGDRGAIRVFAYECETHATFKRWPDACGAHNTANGYGAKDFAYSNPATGGDGKTYRAKVNVPAGTALSNATYWEVYVDPNGATWDGAKTAAMRTQAPLRPMYAARRQIARSAAYAALQKGYYEGLASVGIQRICQYQLIRTPLRNPDVASALSDVYPWGILESELDTSNPMFTAFTELATELDG